jgi:creatinine amidohydrolase/Fe(II)-dependent formamide hydrolase-like protein
MAGEILNFADLTTREIDHLDRGNTLFLMVLSPLEVHGPHLPLGTDVFVAEEVRDRTLDKLKKAHPDYDYVLLPPYYLGSDTIPGSVVVDSRAIFLTLKATGKFLSQRGFKYLLLFDNHGGPRHQIAEAKAARYLYEKESFHLIAPFLSFYRKMVEHDAELLQRIQAGPGACGDVDDCHGGLNETSLMLALSPQKVRPEWRELSRTAIKKKRWPALLLDFAAFLARGLGASELARDLEYIGTMLCWTTERHAPNYIGEPRAATAEAGERMLDAFADEALSSFEASLEGKAPLFSPLGWTLRFLEPSR